MYLRRVTRRNRDGSEVSYVQLAHNVWDPVKRCSVTQVIHKFGREDQLDREALQRLARSITRFLDPEQALAAQAPEGTNFLRAVSMGGAWLLDHLWRLLGVAEAIGRVAKRRRVSQAVERLIFCLVANRALDPMSKLAALEWAQKDTWLPGIGGLGSDPQIFYRSMDFLLDCDEEIQREVFFAVSDLLNLDVDLLLFDLDVLRDPGRTRGRVPKVWREQGQEVGLAPSGGRVRGDQGGDPGALLRLPG